MTRHGYAKEAPKEEQQCDCGKHHVALQRLYVGAHGVERDDGVGILQRGGNGVVATVIAADVYHEPVPLRALDAEEGRLLHVGDSNAQIAEQPTHLLDFGLLLSVSHMS